MDSVGGGVWSLWILEGMVVKKCELEWVLNGVEGEGIEGVKCEEVGMEMVCLRMWVMAMDEKRGNLEMVCEKMREWELKVGT